MILSEKAFWISNAIAKIFKLDHHKRQFRSENFVQTLQKREPCTYLKSGSGRSGGCNALGELSCSKFTSFCFTTFSWLQTKKNEVSIFFKKSTKYPKNSKDASPRLLLAYCTFYSLRVVDMTLRRSGNINEGRTGQFVILGMRNRGFLISLVDDSNDWLTMCLCLFVVNVYVKEREPRL